MRYLVMPLIVVISALGGCTGPIIMGTDAAIIVATKPWGEPDADIQDQIQPHQSWCYQTMGDTECYSHVQDVQPSRLVSVQPANLYPLDVTAYHKALSDDRAIAMASPPDPVTLAPTLSDADAEKKTLSDELRRATETPTDIMSP